MLSATVSVSPLMSSGSEERKKGKANDPTQKGIQSTTTTHVT